MVRGTITDIQRYSVHDGPGMRTTVFLKGCPLHCRWCCNPEAMHREPVLFVNPKLCIGCGACREVCPSGAADGIRTNREGCLRCGACAEVCYAGARYFKERKLSSEEMLAEIQKDKVFYDRTGGGVTFSGGEAAMQIDFLEETLSLCRASEIHTAIETCGAMPWDYYERLLPLIELFLFDIKTTDDAVHRAYTGGGCTGIMENCRSILKAGAHLIVRVPVIPRFNFSVETLTDIVRFAESAGAKEVNFLPYHRYAQNKYDFMEQEYWNPGVTSLTHEEVQAVVTRIDSALKLVVNG